MPSRCPLSGLAVVVAALALALAACAEPAAEGCAGDADCPAGRRCDGGACVADTGGGGAGGTAPLEDECGASDDCLASPLVLTPSIYWDGSADPAEPTCMVPAGRCPDGSLCPIATICAPQLPDATKPGGVRCELDEQCRTGRCIELDGVKSCLRACDADADCPYVQVDPPAGLACREVVEAGVPLQSCGPIDPAFPFKTLCRHDCDCVGTDDCAGLATDELRCRFDGQVHDLGNAVPVCSVPPPASERPTLSQCLDDSHSCWGGGCSTQCQARGDGSDFHFCSTAARRCTQPCERDTDCPARANCVVGTQNGRIGDWRLPFQEEGDTGRDLLLCQLPGLGCFDEADCCPEPDGAGGCIHGWSPVRQRCTVELSATRPQRLLTRCTDPDPALLAPGACCADDAECDAGVCVPERPGGPCGGGGICSVPCDPDPDPDGVPGSADDRDRCALSDFGASTYHRGSRCLPYLLRRTIEGAAGPEPLEVELRVCR